MNDTQKTYTHEQHQLIAELSATYGLQPEQITFFDDDPEPFFDRDATAVLIQRLCEPVGIDDDLVNAPSPDTVAVKYSIEFKDGTYARSTRMANLGEVQTVDQAISLATARAARSALRNRGISLIKLHTRVSTGSGSDRGINTVQFSGPPRGEYETLLREAHALGRDAGFILRDTQGVEGQDKRAWYNVLSHRYHVGASSALNLDQLRDFVAFLRSQLPSKAAA